MLWELDHLGDVFRTVVAWYIKLLLFIFMLDLLLPLVQHPKVRYYACYFCYVMTSSTACILYIPLLILRFNDPSNISLPTQALRMLSKLIGIKWELRGGKYLVKDEAAVVVLTHQSIFDMMGVVVFGRTLQKACCVSKKEVFYYWPFGLALWLAGVVFIDRNNGKKSNQMLAETMRQVKGSKTKLLMFPEGTRNQKGDTLLPFKRGAFRMAIEAQIPIIPVVYSPYYFINSEKKTFHKGKVILSTLQPISTKGKTIADLDIFMEKTQSIMEEEYQKLKIEIEHKYGPLKT